MEYATLLGALPRALPVACLLFGLGQGQVGQLPPPPKGLKPPGVLVASDNKAVAPGRVPEDASERARALWARAVEATGGRAPKALGGFDLRFEIIVRREHSLNNLGVAQYRFWSEMGYLRSEWSKSGRIQVRGPQGDWLIEQGVKTELVGRENTQSRRELSEWVAIARNFLALATPSATRLVELSEVGQLDVAFPTGTLVERARELEWISVKSPDFRLMATPELAADPVYRAYLGLAKSSGEVRIAVLHEGSARDTLGESTLLVEIVRWSQLGERRIPEQIKVYSTHREGRDWVFDDRPGADMYLLKGGVLDPPFQADEFLP